MGHVRLICLVAGAIALAVLCAPAVALAGTYDWSLPGDFTASSPGANPEHKYFEPSWSYEAGTPGGTNLQTFSPSFTNGGLTLAGWTGGTNQYVAEDSSGNFVMDSGSGSLTESSSVTVKWSDPFPSSEPVTVNYSFTPVGVGCTGTEAVVDQGDDPVLSGTQDLLPAGGALYFTATSGLLGASCPVDATLDVSATGTAPAISLTSPTNGATFSNGQPDYAGTASTGFGVVGTVTVDVYQGAGATGTPVQIDTGTAGSGGAYTVAPSKPLANGQYTAVAHQSDLAEPADVGSSAPVTFTVNNTASTAPSLTLDSLGTAALPTGSPTLTGIAGTRSQDSKTVSVAVFAGSNLSGQPVRFMTGTVSANGDFSVPVTPALPNGQYSAIAGQVGDGALGFSNMITFQVSIRASGLSLVLPAAGSSVSRSNLIVSGLAATGQGDSATVTIYLYRGASTKDKLYGKRSVRIRNPSWSYAWPSKLKNGLYTARVQQVENGKTVRTSAHTFLAVPGRTTIGSYVSLSPSGTVTVPITCSASVGGSCIGTVLITTTRSFRTTSGGPSGRLRLLYTYVQTASGTTRIVRGAVSSSVAKVLRRAKHVTVKVTTVLSGPGGAPTTFTGTRTLTIKS